jgi:hypothetical protein
MAVIFISYSRQDADVIDSYAKHLSVKHTLVYDRTIKNEKDFSEALRVAQQRADGTVVFLTKNGLSSSNVIAEAGAASTLMESGKFLIPVVEGQQKLPYNIERLQWIPFEPYDIQQGVLKIEEAIKVWSKSQSKAESQKAKQPSASISEPSLSSATGRMTPPAQKKSPVLKKAFKKAQEKNSDSKPTAQNGSCWFLKINEREWGSTIGAGEEAFFHSYEATQIKRPDYKNFEKIRGGEKIIAYACNGLNAVIAIFEVMKALHQDSARGEIITMKAVRQFLPVIPLTSFRDKINFLENISYQSKSKLFPLDESAYTDIINSPVSGARFNQLSYTELPTDSPSVKIKDQLGFEKDVTALASVMAYNKVQPPLAIGLFGNWGSGKSFFMNKLEEEIKRLSDLKSNDYCSKVVQIKFNSWHYSDSNLWASMITKIFDDLEKYSKADKDQLESLFTNLNSAKELIAEANEDIRKVDGQIVTLSERQVELEKKIEENKVKLNGVSYWNIAKGIFSNNERIQSKINEGKNKFDFLKSGDLEAIDANITRLNSEKGRLSETIKIAVSFRSLKLYFALASAIGIYLLMDWLIDQEIIFKKINEAGVIVKWASLALSQFMILLQPAFRKVKEAQAFLQDVKKITDAEAVKVYSAEKANVEADLVAAQNQKIEIGTNMGALEAKKAAMLEELKSIQSGKRLVRFIEGRVTDERYVNSLGIISWIRKDFEELDFLLKQQHELKRREKDPNKVKEMSDLAEQQKSGAFEMERIILYIDDLDRCEVAIVVRVLEAIHLLLAFPLFVVVVGVDPRWMHNALRTKYSDLFTGNGINENAGKRENLTDTLIPGKPATSYDYLEKIFQIPLVLKVINKTGKDRLIRSQFTNGEETQVLVKEPQGNPVGNNIGSPASEGTIHNAVPSTPPVSTGNNPIDGTPLPNNKSGTNVPPAKGNGYVNTEQLKVSEDEIQFMQSIGFLVGESPRNIKRYINIYRIIRTHPNFEFLDDNVLQDYYAAMVLLGILTSAPDAAKEFFNELHNGSDVTTFNEFLTSFLSERKKDKRKSNAKVPGEKPENNKEKIDYYVSIRTLTSNMREEEYSTLRDLGEMSLKKFKQNSDLICRFSFRDVSS